jgi:hypothetical protein
MLNALPLEVASFRQAFLGVYILPEATPQSGMFTDYCKSHYNTVQAQEYAIKAR